LNPDLALILLDLSLPYRSGVELIGDLRATSPDVPVVVLSATDDRETVLRTIHDGAMGFIPKSSRTEVLIAALKLVFSGGVYLPPSVFTATGAGSHAAARPSAVPGKTAQDIGLTQRQGQVLSLLVQGKSNKLICRALNLAEGTVKIHVTAILRALNVTNRTEALVAVSRLGLRFDELVPGRGSSARPAAPTQTA
jgi:DNA-binding NarL/FixJ family response regulator